ncbi:hypothetical protein L218DRAFT_948973 [Marasmius fiardii PR-910]|nr:hypothetical protein L218DRAFT_948973 [Marasmius fiardii PR-910]
MSSTSAIEAALALYLSAQINILHEQLQSSTPAKKGRGKVKPVSAHLAVIGFYIYAKENPKPSLKRLVNVTLAPLDNTNSFIYQIKERVYYIIGTILCMVRLRLEATDEIHGSTPRGAKIIQCFPTGLVTCLWNVRTERSIKRSITTTMNDRRSGVRPTSNRIYTLLKCGIVTLITQKLAISTKFLCSDSPMSAHTRRALVGTLIVSSHILTTLVEFGLSWVNEALNENLACAYDQSSGDLFAGPRDLPEYWGYGRVFRNIKSVGKRLPEGQASGSYCSSAECSNSKKEKKDRQWRVNANSVVSRSIAPRECQKDDWIQKHCGERKQADERMAKTQVGHGLS